MTDFSAPEGHRADDLVERSRQLAALRDDGQLTEDEFHAAWRELVDVEPRAQKPT